LNNLEGLWTHPRILDGQKKKDESTNPHLIGEALTASEVDLINSTSASTG
jgi:hypothetical protein